MVDPSDKPVTKPLLSIEATVVLLLTQLPALLELKIVVSPIHKFKSLPGTIVGLPFTTINSLGSEMHPTDVENINLADPLDTPVINPVFVIEATAGFVLIQLPPVVGEILEEDPTQINDGPVRLIKGFVAILMGVPNSEKHPVAVSVNLKVADPVANPVTSPALETAATEGLLLIQVPPKFGESDV